MNIHSFSHTLTTPKKQFHGFAGTQPKIEGFTVGELTRNGDQLERVITNVLHRSERENSTEVASQLATLFRISDAKPTFCLAIARRLVDLAPNNPTAKELLPTIQASIIPILDARMKRMEGRIVPPFELGVTLDTLLCFPTLIKPHQINLLEEKSAGNVEMQIKISTLKSTAQNAP